MQESFKFTLSTPIKIHKNGEVEACFSLEIKAPTNKQLIQLTTIEQACLKAAMTFSNNTTSLPKDKDNEPDEKINVAEAYVSAMLASGADMRSCYDSLRQILLESCFADNQKFTQYHFDQMSPHDTSLLLGEYIANFTRFSQ